VLPADAAAFEVEAEGFEGAEVFWPGFMATIITSWYSPWMVAWGNTSKYFTSKINHWVFHHGFPDKV